MEKAATISSASNESRIMALESALSVALKVISDIAYHDRHKNKEYLNLVTEYINLTTSMIEENE